MDRKKFCTGIKDYEDAVLFLSSLIIILISSGILAGLKQESLKRQNHVRYNEILQFFKEMRKFCHFHMVLWFLHFIMANKVNTIENTVVWRMGKPLCMGIGSFIMATLCVICWTKEWKALHPRKLYKMRVVEWLNENPSKTDSINRLSGHICFILPFFSGRLYQTKALWQQLLCTLYYLGLNIISLGIVSPVSMQLFYAVELTHMHCLSFWLFRYTTHWSRTVNGYITAIPKFIRGDYLAIVTSVLVKLLITLENWTNFLFVQVELRKI